MSPEVVGRVVFGPPGAFETSESLAQIKSDALTQPANIPALTMQVINGDDAARAEAIATLSGVPTKPPPPLDVTATDALPEPPSEAEILAVLALPVDARYALTADRGPGWTVHPTAPQAIPRLRPPAVTLIPGTIGAWLPAGVDVVVDLVASCLSVGRRDAFRFVGAEVSVDVPVRLAGLRVLGRVWR